MRFRDRRDAGRQLSERLAGSRLHDPLILALPRGGVPVAFEVAKALSAPLDVFIVRTRLPSRYTRTLSTLGALSSATVICLRPIVNEILAST